MSALITALESGLSKDEATVKAAIDKLQAAHEAEHANRGPGKMFSALATELKLDEATVKSAFESVLGTPPAKRTAAAKAAAKKKAAAKAAAKRKAAAKKTK